MSAVNSDVASFISSLVGSALGLEPVTKKTKLLSPLADARLFNMVYATITSAVERIAVGTSSEERVRFLCSESQKFVWIMISRMGESKLLACTNDRDLSIGHPPSFWHTCLTTERESLITVIVNHLGEALTGFKKIEVLHECSLADGQKSS